MTRWAFTIEYDGSAYAGWQRQADVPSVQQTIEEAAAKMLQQPVALTVAGRTDAGVHAKGQVAHADLTLDRAYAGFELAKGINAHLRLHPISIIRAQAVGEDFNARFSAINKLYTYRIIARPQKLSFDHNRAWHVYHPLDVAAMRAGAVHLMGHHDFSTFRDAQCQAKTPLRTLMRLDIEEHMSPHDESQHLAIHVEAKSFLHHQVRNMVGTLALVGQGKWTPEDIKSALAARDRTKGGPTAPACGLYLMRVDYTQ
ncbi:MAG: tRNA pseudouridine(38-40) synthase TruA [Alphaproteobacteria bacterium]|nr:tRNA pseudouridine(38-40) synthase TruA [Alphaproteobacteria bacterium]